MAKYDQRLEARELRAQGVSVKYIAEKLNISKSSASIWVRDIILSIEQLEALRKSALQGAERGRLRNALLQKEKRTRRLETSKQLGIKKLANLTNREYFIAGLALYWAEGSKKQQEVEFCNSDPAMIKFWIKWLNRMLDVKNEELRCRVGINEVHKKREEIVKKYWCDITGVPLEQFTKTSFKKVQNKKVYKNYDQHFGTLSIWVIRPSRYYFQLMGYIHGLGMAG